MECGQDEVVDTATVVRQDAAGKYILMDAPDVHEMSGGAAKKDDADLIFFLVPDMLANFFYKKKVVRRHAIARYLALGTGRH